MKEEETMKSFKTPELEVVLFNTEAVMSSLNGDGTWTESTELNGFADFEQDLEIK